MYNYTITINGKTFAFPSTMPLTDKDIVKIARILSPEINDAFTGSRYSGEVQTVQITMKADYTAFIRGS